MLLGDVQLFVQSATDERWRPCGRW